MPIFLYFTCIVYYLGITKPCKPLVCKQSQQLEVFFFVSESSLLMVSYFRKYISFYGHIIYRSTVVKWLKCWYVMVPTWNTLIMLFVMPSIGRFTIAAAKFLCFCWIVEPRWFILFLYLVYLHFLKALYLVSLLTDLLPTWNQPKEVVSVKIWQKVKTDHIQFAY